MSQVYLITMACLTTWLYNVLELVRGRAACGGPMIEHSSEIALRSFIMASFLHLVWLGSARESDHDTRLQ